MLEYLLWVNNTHIVSLEGIVPDLTSNIVIFFQTYFKAPLTSSWNAV